MIFGIQRFEMCIRDRYYRVHAQTFGWLDWACNGASAGSAGYAKRLEAIQIVLVPKGGKAPGSTAAPYKELPPAVSYQSYLSGAWQNSVLDNAVSGTVGQAKQIEGIKISLQDKACLLYTSLPGESQARPAAPPI